MVCNRCGQPWMHYHCWVAHHDEDGECIYVAVDGDEKAAEGAIVQDSYSALQVEQHKGKRAVASGTGVTDLITNCTESNC